MKAITRRIGRLEKRLAPPPDIPGPSLADIVRERRRRRLEAAGAPFPEPAPMPIPVGPGKPRTVVEILRHSRQLAYERNRAAVLSDQSSAVTEGARVP